MIALLFPGQGSERPRMGLAVAARDPEAAALLDHAGAVAGVDARAVLQRGGDRLAATAVLQPIMTAVSLGLVAALERAGVGAELALGHSLGEVAAWAALGGVSARAAIELAGVRGRECEAIASTHDGAMLALPDLGDDELAAVLGWIAARELAVVPALHNAPGRWVLSGDHDALRSIAARFGGRMLATSGAWHSPRYAPARIAWAAAMRRRTVAPTPGLIVNVSGTQLGEGDAVAALSAQLDGPVRFAACVETLRALRPRALLLLTASKHLRALLRDNGWADAPSFDVETPADVEAVAARLARLDRREHAGP